MTSLFILIAGTIWEASMDIIASKRNYERSIWNKLANYCDRKGYHFFGQSYWDYEIAWRNKWKNGDPKQGPKFFMSSTALVTYMDGWHLMKFFWLVHLFSAIVEYTPMTPYSVVDLMIYYITFGTFHSFFFKILQVDPIKENRNN
jgi:hypothetical protein